MTWGEHLSRLARLIQWIILVGVSLGGLYVLVTGAAGPAESSLLAGLLFLAVVNGCLMVWGQRVAQVASFPAHEVLEIIRVAQRRTPSDLAHLLDVARRASSDQAHLAGIALSRAGLSVVGWLVVACEQSKGARRRKLLGVASRCTGERFATLTALARWHDANRAACDSAFFAAFGEQPPRAPVPAAAQTAAAATPEVSSESAHGRPAEGERAPSPGSSA